MDRCAVFVDAGYLFAQGSAAVTGSKKSRDQLLMNAKVAVNALIEFACTKATDCRILRVYWYDGAIGGVRPTSDQALVANLDNVKLRLGFVNSHGQQKGVDSLIVTDLIELARLKSITDAVLLSGDEDVRVGVQIAQNYGVRVHLLGIAPSRGSQSQQLMQEADTTSEWGRDTVSTFLTLREGVADLELTEAALAVPSEVPDAAFESSKIEIAATVFVKQLEEADIKGIEAYWETNRGVPPDLDGKLLRLCASELKRRLDKDEVGLLRSFFQKAVKSRGTSPD